MNYSNLKDEKEIYDTFLKLNPISKGSIKRPYLILIDGITGTGKSTVARIIFQKTNIIVLNNDKIRQFIYKTNFNKDWKEEQKLVKKIQYYRIEQILKNGNNCILDGDISNNFESKISIIEELNCKYYIIKLIYDRKKVIERIKNRKLDKEALTTINGSETINYSNATVDDFLRMEKGKYNIPNKYIYFEIDTSKDINNIENQIEKLIDKINSENKQI